MRVRRLVQLDAGDLRGREVLSKQLGEVVLSERREGGHHELRFFPFITRSSNGTSTGSIGTFRTPFLVFGSSSVSDS